MLLITPGLSNY